MPSIHVFTLVLSRNAGNVCLWRAVLLGPVQSATYLLNHGLMAGALGALLARRTPWAVGIPVAAGVRVAGQLGFLALSSWTLNENLVALLLSNVYSLLVRAPVLICWGRMSRIGPPSLLRPHAWWGSWAPRQRPAGRRRTRLRCCSANVPSPQLRLGSVSPRVLIPGQAGPTLHRLSRDKFRKQAALQAARSGPSHSPAGKFAVSDACCLSCKAHSEYQGMGPGPRTWQNHE